MAANYTTFNTVAFVNSSSTGFDGAAYDGHYVYLVPNTNGQITRLDAYTGPSQVVFPLTAPLTFVTLQLAGTVSYVPPASAILSILDTITVAGPQSALYGMFDAPTFALLRAPTPTFTAS